MLRNSIKSITVVALAALTAVPAMAQTPSQTEQITSMITILNECPKSVEASILPSCNATLAKFRSMRGSAQFSGEFGDTILNSGINYVQTRRAASLISGGKSTEGCQVVIQFSQDHPANLSRLRALGAPEVADAIQKAHVPFESLYGKCREILAQ